MRKAFFLPDTSTICYDEYNITWQPQKKSEKKEKLDSVGTLQHSLKETESVLLQKRVSQTHFQNDCKEEAALLWESEEVTQ